MSPLLVSPRDFPGGKFGGTKNQDYNDENYSKLRHANTSEHKALTSSAPGRVVSIKGQLSLDR